MKKTQKNSLSFEQLRRYVAGQLPYAQQHEVEKAALEDPTTDDTLAGLAQMKQANINPDDPQADLRQRLRARIQPPQHRVVAWWTYASAAMLVLTLGLGWYWFSAPNSTNLAQEKMDTALVPPNSLPPPAQSAPATAQPSAPTPRAKPVPPIAEKRLAQVSKKVLEEVKGDEGISDAVSADVAPIAPPAEAAVPKMSLAKVAQTPVSSFVLRGQVRSATDQMPLPAAIIINKDTNQNATTDLEGRFMLPDVQPGDVFNVISMGFLPQQIAPKDSMSQSILLQEDTQGLSEVVVTSRNKKEFDNQRVAAPTIGWENYEKYLKNSVARFYLENHTAPKGKITLTFTVSETGELGNFKAKNKANDLLVQKAIEFIGSGVAWLPARKNGQDRNSTVKLTVHFE